MLITQNETQWIQLCFFFTEFTPFISPQQLHYHHHTFQIIMKPNN